MWVRKKILLVTDEVEVQLIEDNTVEITQKLYKYNKHVMKLQKSEFSNVLCRVIININRDFNNRFVGPRRMYQRVSKSDRITFVGFPFETRSKLTQLDVWKPIIDEVDVLSAFISSYVVRFGFPREVSIEGLGNLPQATLIHGFFFDLGIKLYGDPSLDV